MVFCITPSQMTIPPIQRTGPSIKISLILNLAVGGTWGGAGGAPIPSDYSPSNPQILEIDYVRVYQ